MNKKLLCTKFAHDYTYYLIEDNIQKTVDSSFLNSLETKLIQNDCLNLPNDAKVNGTYGYYFDTNTKSLKCGIWSYDNRKDDRGYLEVEFITLDVTDTIDINFRFLDNLKSLLITTYTYFEKELYPIFSINLDYLFKVRPKTEELEIFLKLYFSFLPSNIASRIIFIHNYAEYLINIGNSIDYKTNELSVKHSFSNIYKCCLIDWLYCSISTFEYKALLYLSLITLFKYDIKLNPYSKHTISITSNNCLNLVESNSKMSFLDRFNIIFKFYESFCSKKFDDKITDIISNFIINIMQKLLNELYSTNDFNTKLERYKGILTKIKLIPKNSNIYLSLKDRLYFSQQDIGNNSQESLVYVKRCFKILVTLGEDILNIDAIYYSNKCFNFIKNSKTATELNDNIKTIDNSYSINEFFNVVNPIYIGNDINLLYDAILNKSLLLLKEYYGYCDTSDMKFITLNTEIELIIEFANMINKNPKQVFLSMYAVNCQDKMLLQNLSMYFIDEDTITLTDLLNLVKDFNIIDFYTKFNLVIFDGLISSLNRSLLSSNEKIQLIKFLQLYKVFRNEYDDIINLCMEQKYSQKDLNNNIYTLSNKSGDFIKTYLSTYNVCKSKEARQILSLVNKNIVGNPSLSTMIMYTYTQNIVGKTIFYKYTYYYQLYKLLFDFLIQDEDLSIKEVQYLKDMSIKNSSIFHKETLGNKICYKLKLEFNKVFLNKSSFRNIINNISIPKIFMKFINMLHTELSKRYNLNKEEHKSLLLKELQDYNNAYEYLFSNSMLNEYYYDYISMLIKYIIQQIKR